LDNLKKILTKIPLLLTLVLTSLALSLVAYAGRDRGYRDYEVDPAQEPFLSVVLTGLHDHVYPWTDPDRKTEKEEPEPEAGDKTEESSEAKEEESGEAPEPSEGEGGSENAEASPEETSSEEGEGTEEPSQEGSEEEGQGEETQEAEPEPEPEPEPEKPWEPTIGSHAVVLQNQLTAIPDGVCSPVVGAKDYGVADSRYRSPEDTVYNTDTEGLFAMRNFYYLQTSVDSSYFSDALFIGDSRTGGFSIYGNMNENCSFIYKESLSVYTVFSEMLTYRKSNGTSYSNTLEEILTTNTFDKIYICLGVNELGIPDTIRYYERYRTILERIHEMQPDAILYIQGVMHVSEKKSSEDDTYNNTIIVERNKAVATLANGWNIFYIDMNSAVCDDNGNLLPELSSDGVHLYGSQYGRWTEFLKGHAIVR
jgi:lysophospholipase L1-like esterase